MSQIRGIAIFFKEIKYLIEKLKFNFFLENRVEKYFIYLTKKKIFFYHQPK